MRRPTVLLLALLSSCSSPICGCIADFTGHAVLRGTLLDGSAAPVPDAQLGVAGSAFSTVPSPAFTGPDGSFSFLVSSLYGPGTQLLDLVIVWSGSVAPDTIQDVSVDFRVEGAEPPDTLAVTLTVSE